jgi:hypothetical protein
MRRRWQVPERDGSTRANLAREVQTSWQKQQPVEPSEEEVVDGINEDQSEKEKDCARTRA